MEHFVDREDDPKPAQPVGQGSLQPLPSCELIHNELERVLASKTFHAAEGQKKFLRFVVEHTVSGRPHEVKEYTVGVEVFGRGQAFDPRLNNIVRAEARKLRSRLAKYYEGEGLHDPVRIALPSRGYVPLFRGANSVCEAPADAVSPVVKVDDPVNGPGAPAMTPAPFRHWWRVALLASVLAATAAVIYAARLEWALRKPLPPGPSIAVLPFRNLGETKDESFSDGLTDELIDSLGRVQGLQVVARTSAFQFRSPKLDVREIGEKLNVRTVLEGSVRIYGTRLRITAQLDDTTNGYRVWSDSYERDFQDALFIQRDISQAIVAALGAEFAKSGSPNRLKFSPSRTVAVNPEAYQDYLRGLYFWNRQTSDSIATSMRYFHQSIAKDPTYALPFTGLARCYVNIPAFSRTRGREVGPKIRELALKALLLDNSLAEPHIDLAYAAFLNYEWDIAEAEFKKGLELSPSDAVGHRWYAVYLANVGRLEDALRENETSQKLDSVSPYMLDGVARALYRLRRYDEAVEQFNRTLALEPMHAHAHLGLGATYLQKRMYTQAIAELQEANREMRDNPAAAAGLAYAYALSGNRSEARQILRRLLDESARGPFPAKPIAEIYVGLGENSLAFEWLEKAIDGQDVNLYLKGDPIYDSLRSDPRFAQLLRRARLN